MKPTRPGETPPRSSSPGHPRAFEAQAIQATVWTSILLHARMIGDFEEAARAQSELDALGLEVRFRSPTREGDER